jgi:hypothetical protein
VAEQWQLRDVDLVAGEHHFLHRPVLDVLRTNGLALAARVFRDHPVHVRVDREREPLVRPVEVDQQRDLRIADALEEHRRKARVAGVVLQPVDDRPSLELRVDLLPDDLQLLRMGRTERIEERPEVLRHPGLA